MRGGSQGDEDALAISTEATQFYNEEQCPLAVRVEALVVETVQVKCRQENGQLSNLGRLKVRSMHFWTSRLFWELSKQGKA